MTDGIMREVNIRIQAINAAKTHQELRELTVDCDRFAREATGATDAINRLKRALATAERGWKDGSRLAKADAQALQESTQALKDNLERWRAFTRARITARKAESSIKTSEVGGRNSANDSVLIDAAITKRKEEARTFSSGLRERLEGEQQAAQAVEKTTVAQKKLNQANSDRKFEASLAGLSKEEVATKRLERANEQLAAAKRQVKVANSSGDQAQITAAYNNQAKAVQNVTRAEQAHNRASANNTGSLPRLRYALYDVSTTATFTGIALLGLAAATVGASISMDRDFADVVRTTGTYLDTTGQSTRALRDEFNDLFTSLPTSWSALTDIGTLAGQLGVAKQDVAEFTSLVAKFSTVTGVSVEESATAFGRLSELLNVSASEYENLGSSILATGVSSVATESQIINVSSQIASIGSYAGFSADEVIGLSSSLSSLGVQPELARGTITRLFTNISVAISDGGDKLEAFGRLTGQSGEDFKKAWGEDAAGALQSFLTGLGQVDANGGNSIATLKELGITAARDVPTLLKLAQNSQLVGEQFDIASKGFADGTAIQDQYGVVAETVASKLGVLKNNLQLMAATAGGSTGPLSKVIDLLTKMVSALTDLINNPVGQFLVTTTVAVVAAAGALALLAGGAARGTASMLALKTAMIEGAVANGTYATSAEAAAAGTWTLATSIKGVKYALISTGLGIALVALGTAAAYLWEQFDKSKSSIGGLVMDLNGLQTAMAGDTKAALDGTAESFKTLTFYTDTSGKALTSAEAQSLGYSDAMANLGKNVGDTTDSVNEQKIAVGDLTKEWLLNELTTGEFGKKFKEIWPEIQSLMQNSGLDLSGYLNDLLSGKDVDLSPLSSNLKTQLDEVNRQLAPFWAELGPAETATSTDPVVMRLRERQASILEQQKAIETLNAFSKELNGTITDTATQMAITSALSTALGVSVDGTGTSAADASANFDAMAQSIQDTIAGYTDAQSQMLSTEAALASLGQGLRDGGLDWSQYTDAGRANLGNLLSTMDAIAAESPGDASTIASNFQALFDTLVNGGYATAAQLDVLRQAIQGLVVGEGAKVTKTGKDFSSFFNGWSTGAEKAKKSTSAAKKEIRTLLDYAGDLANVWGRAFDIRFDSQSTLDTISTSFISIRDAADESAKAIADLQREISGLATDISTQQYFLSIAVNYGDVLRQAEIQKDLADLQAQMADKQSQLTDEQAKNSKVLTGNSKAAITNRKQMTDLVGEYEAHIKALAESGLSSSQLAVATSQLKQQFIAQTTALGYASDEVQTYAAAFDDVALAIQRIPRNITVTADANPALQALNEFQAKLDSVRASAAQPTTLGAVDYAKNARGAKLDSEMQGLLKALPLINYGPALASAQKRILDIANALTSGNYYDGGFTGSGGKYEPAGVVHRGEYVVPKHGVDQRTGLPKQDYIGNLSRSVSNAPSYAKGGYVGGMGYNGPIRLDAFTIQQLGHVMNKGIYLDGKPIADSVGRANQQSTRTGSK